MTGDQELIVLDAKTGRLQRLSLEGEFISQLVLPVGRAYDFKVDQVGFTLLTLISVG